MHSEAPHFSTAPSETSEHASTMPAAKLGSAALKNSPTPESSSSAKTTPQQSAERFIHRHGEQLSLFARDSSLHFVPSTSAKTFAFFPKTFEVQVPTSWFANEKYDENELQFANYHELAHFIDMRKNPTVFLDNFSCMEKDAQALATQYLATHSSSHSSKSIAHFFQEELRSLYNVLDDIYVNNLVFGRNHFFDYGDGKASVGTLYEKLGFADQDLTSRPLHEQMIYTLLRDEMLGPTHGKSTVDPRVQEVFSKKKLGKTIPELVESELKPKRGILVDPAHRYAVIRNLIQPEYLKLLDISLEDLRPQQGSSTGDSSKDNGHAHPQQNPSNTQQAQENGSIEQGPPDTFDPFNKNGQASPQDIFSDGPSEDAIKDILKSFQEADKVSKMSPEERTKYQANKQREEFDQKYNITEKERSINEKIKTKIRPLRKEMRQFWHNLIGKSIEYRQVTIPRQKKGRINIGSFVEQYPAITEAERRGDFRALEIYDRQGLERSVIDQPERIDITLLVDCSGSMESSGKIAAARESAALLMYSIKDFNDELAISRRQTHSKLRASTEVIVFGSNHHKVKSFDSVINHSQNDAEIIKSLARINSNLGSTDDAAPLAMLAHSLSPEDKAKLKSKKLKKIVFEITDGAPDNPAITAKHLRRLSEEGVLVVGFQIGNVGSEERSTFEQTWHSISPNQQGIYIGTDISDLPGRLMAALSESLNNIII